MSLSGSAFRSRRKKFRFKSTAELDRESVNAGELTSIAFRNGLDWEFVEKDDKIVIIDPNTGESRGMSADTPEEAIHFLLGGLKAQVSIWKKQNVDNDIRISLATKDYIRLGGKRGSLSVD